MKDFINNHPFLTTGIIFGAYSTITQVFSTIFRKQRNTCACYLIKDSKKDVVMDGECVTMPEQEEPIKQEV